MDKVNGYVAGFNGQQVEVWANSLWAAKQEALKVFKPSKKQAGLVWVLLAEQDGQPVEQVATN